MGYQDVKEMLKDARNLATGANDYQTVQLLKDIQLEVYDLIDENRDLRLEIEELKQGGYEYYLYYFDKNNNILGSTPFDDFDNLVSDLSNKDANHDNYKLLKYSTHFENTLLLNGATRLNSMEAFPYSTTDPVINNVVNSLIKNASMLQEIRDYILDAFNLNLEIFIDGANAKLVLAKNKMPNELELSIKPEAIDFLKENAYFSENTSDGRKAYLGILSEIISGNPTTLLLDEPEAFLHPPLARKLGSVISQLSVKDNNKQIFISTHSSDFIMGCIEAHVPLNIARLTYENNVSTFKSIDAEVIYKIMNDPLLKSTNVLKAIFYQKVIVTEADSDRAFYEEINNRLLDYKPEWGIKDCLFINAQNKQTTGIIVKTLRSIGVSAIALVDLDFIKEGGGQFSNKFLIPANIPAASFSGLQSNRTTLNQAFQNIQKETGSDKPEILKTMGIDAFKTIDNATYQMGEEFLESLNAYGLFPVPTGELESWLKDLKVPGHGTYWLTTIFEKMGNDPSSADFVKPSDDDVWKFISTIKNWFDNPNKKGMTNIS